MVHDFTLDIDVPNDSLEKSESADSILSGYQVGPYFDEMFTEGGQPRPDCQALYDRLQKLTPAEIARRQHAAQRSMVQSGITFNVYGDEQGRERIIPFDILPRIVQSEEWEWVEQGLTQRIRALNCFLEDIYHDQRIVKEGVVPEHVIQTAAAFRPQCCGITPPRGIWCHITGTDLIRDGDGQMYVLEDNLRCPSGVSYVLQNRQLVKKTFPQIFGRTAIRPVDDYPGRLAGGLDVFDGRTRASTQRGFTVARLLQFGLF